MIKKLCIIGCGGFAREAYTIISASGLESEFFAFFQSDEHYQPHKIYGMNVLPISKFEPTIHQAVVAIADGKLREKLVNELPTNTTYYNLLHPTVILSKHNIEIGSGSIICAGSILTCDIKLGGHCILNLSTTIGHDCIIDDYFTTTPGVNISGRCIIGKRVYIGTNASLRGHNKICHDVTIGMGGVVLRDILEPGTYIGNPVKKMKEKST
jgi:sugar O-acyltransferase (sialic acid O-acetyltransferase NeuD family)